MNESNICGSWWGGLFGDGTSNACATESATTNLEQATNCPYIKLHEVFVQCYVVVFTAAALVMYFRHFIYSRIRNRNELNATSDLETTQTSASYTAPADVFSQEQTNDRAVLYEDLDESTYQDAASFSLELDTTHTNTQPVGCAGSIEAMVLQQASRDEEPIPGGSRNFTLKTGDGTTENSKKDSEVQTIHNQALNLFVSSVIPIDLRSCILQQ